MGQNDGSCSVGIKHSSKTIAVNEGYVLNGVQNREVVIGGVDNSHISSE